MHFETQVKLESAIFAPTLFLHMSELFSIHDGSSLSVFEIEYPSASLNLDIVSALMRMSASGYHLSILFSVLDLVA